MQSMRYHRLVCVLALSISSNSMHMTDLGPVSSIRKVGFLCSRIRKENVL